MTDGRSGNGLGEEWPSFLPTTLREMVNLVGSLPSLRSRSGSRRRRALMNQLQIWENKYKNCRFQVWEEPIFSAYQPKRSVRQLTQTATFLHLNLYPSTTPSSGTASHMTRQGVRAPIQLAAMKVWVQICWATEKPAKGIPVSWLHNKKLCCSLILICKCLI